MLTQQTSYDKTSSKTRPVFNDKKIIVWLGGRGIHPGVKTSGSPFPFQQTVNKWSVGKDERKILQHLFLLLLRYPVYTQRHTD